MSESPVLYPPIVQFLGDLRASGITSLKKLQILLYLDQPRTPMDIQEALDVDRSSIYKIAEQHDDLVTQLIYRGDSEGDVPTAAGRPTSTAFVLTPIGRKLIKKFKAAARENLEG